MQNRHAQKMNAGKMLLLAIAMVTAFVGPIASGIVEAGPVAGEVGAQNPSVESTNDPINLSDTNGYNFESYMKQITDRVRRSWYSGIPDSARNGQMGRVVVVFTILRDGSTQDMKLARSSGADSLNQASIVAIERSGPFPKLPDDFRDSHIDVQFTFLYNTR